MGKIKTPIARIGTKKEILWQSVATNCKNQIEQHEKELIVQRKVLQLAEGEVLKEKDKFK